jgi:hypothetical protein
VDVLDPQCAKPSTGRRGKSRLVCAAAVVGLASAPLLPPAGASGQARDGPRIEVVATGLVRPVQLAFEPSGRLVVLSHGLGDAAAEIVWLDVAPRLPLDASRLPRVVVPFSDPARQTALGSLAVDPKSGGLVLGEENGNRIYRLTDDKRLTPIVVGLNHLLGGSGFALDDRGRLVVLDDASFHAQRRSEGPVRPAPDSFGADEYQGPLVFRIDLEEDMPLPRRADLISPLFPRPEGRRHAGARRLRFIAVAPLGHDELALLNWVGEVFRLSPAGDLRRLARLPPGQLNRTSLAVAPDGSILVSGGFHIREVYRVWPDGEVTSLARGLGDPQGIAVDRDGAVYVAETALHRVIRILPASGR